MATELSPSEAGSPTGAQTPADGQEVVSSVPDELSDEEVERRTSTLLSQSLESLPEVSRETRLATLITLDDRESLQKLGELYLLFCCGNRIIIHSHSSPPKYYPKLNCIDN